MKKTCGIRFGWNGLVLAFLLVGFAAPGWAAIYYVDNALGNDNNSGLSQSSAWKTAWKTRVHPLQPGDTVLFKRGQVWRELLMNTNSGTSSNPIRFGAYGSGPKPVFSGADRLLDWTPLDGSQQVELVINGGFDSDEGFSLRNGAYASNGRLVLDGGSLYASADQQLEGDVTGTEYQVSYDIVSSNANSSSLYLSKFGNFGGSIPLSSEPGRHTYQVVCEDSSRPLMLVGAPGRVIVMDNLSVRPAGAGGAELSMMQTELVANSGFDSNSDFGFNGGAWISGGALNFESGGDYASAWQQLANDHTGNLYTVTYEVLSSSGTYGTLYLSKYGNFGSVSLNTSPGVHTYELICEDDASNLMLVCPPGKNAKLSYFSIQGAGAELPPPSELVQNGDFSSSSGFVLSGGCSISGGRLRFDSGSGYASADQQLDGDIEGVEYEISYEVISSSADNWGLYFSKYGNFGESTALKTSPGTHTLRLVCADASQPLKLVCLPGYSFAIDNLSVRGVQASPPPDLAEVYKTPLSESPLIVSYNGGLLNRRSVAPSTLNAGEWTHQNGTLYVNTGGDPSQGLLEASARSTSIYNTGSNIVFENLRVTHSKQRGLYSLEGNNITVRYCEAGPTLHQGIFNQWGDNFQAYGNICIMGKEDEYYSGGGIMSWGDCEIRDNEVAFADIGIQITGGAYTGSIHHNYVHHIGPTFGNVAAVDGQGIELTGTSSNEKVHGVDIYRNVVHDCTGAGIATYLADNNRVYENVVFASGILKGIYIRETQGISDPWEGGIAFWVSSNNNQCFDNVVSENHTGIQSTYPSIQSSIFNNVISECEYVGLQFSSGHQSTNNHNLHMINFWNIFNASLGPNSFVRSTFSKDSQTLDFIDIRLDKSPLAPFHTYSEMQSYNDFGSYVRTLVTRFSNDLSANHSSMSIQLSEEAVREDGGGNPPPPVETEPSATPVPADIPAAEPSPTPTPGNPLAGVEGGPGAPGRDIPAEAVPSSTPTAPPKQTPTPTPTPTPTDPPEPVDDGTEIIEPPAEPTPEPADGGDTEMGAVVEPVETPAPEDAIGDL